MREEPRPLYRVGGRFFFFFFFFFLASAARRQFLHSRHLFFASEPLSFAPLPLILYLRPCRPSKRSSPLLHGMRGAAAAAVSRNCNSATPPSTSAPTSSSIPSFRRRTAAVAAPSPPLRASSSRRRASSPSFVAMAAAASAPSAAAPTLKTYDAASMSTQDLLAFTARPRVDFDSILATVRIVFSSLFFLFLRDASDHLLRGGRKARSFPLCVAFLPLDFEKSESQA